VIFQDGDYPNQIIAREQSFLASQCLEEDQEIQEFRPFQDKEYYREWYPGCVQEFPSLFHSIPLEFTVPFEL
jgi:hypothetical protein